MSPSKSWPYPSGLKEPIHCQHVGVRRVYLAKRSETGFLFGGIQEYNTGLYVMGAWDETLREPRRGIMLHYDASASDSGAVSWLRDDPRCRVSYSWLILDNGAVVTIAPVDARAWHAGVCRPSNPDLFYKDANSAFYGIAIAATDGDVATQAQTDAVAMLCVPLFKRHRWSRTNDLFRIVGHDTEAWPRGRKKDPTGSDPSRPVLSVEAIRILVGTP